MGQHRAEDIGIWTVAILVFYICLSDHLSLSIYFLYFYFFILYTIPLHTFNPFQTNFARGTQGVRRTRLPSRHQSLPTVYPSPKVSFLAMKTGTPLSFSLSTVISKFRGRDQFTLKYREHAAGTTLRGGHARVEPQWQWRENLRIWVERTALGIRATIVSVIAKVHWVVDSLQCQVPAIRSCQHSNSLLILLVALVKLNKHS